MTEEGLVALLEERLASLDRQCAEEQQRMEAARTTLVMLAGAKQNLQYLLQEIEDRKKDGGGK